MSDRLAQFRRSLLRWYDRHRRDLPWRVAREAPRDARPEAYRVLVSETMLQQTQVATVEPYFKRFIERFATIEALARADEQEVLRLWQGLGYYSRARNLAAAARAIVRDFGGRVPSDVQVLRTLPGVGRYTAGAIASLAYDERAAILDGNVARVLCRIDRIEQDPHEPGTREQLWNRAEEILPIKRVGDFNSALMELGATVCTPRGPKCPVCPVRAHCEAFAAGVQEQIPPPRRSRPTPLVRRRTMCIRRTRAGREEFLIEQRPATGRWAGMWQFITRPMNGSTPHGCRSIGSITHGLSHRRYEFEVVLSEHPAARIALAGPTVWTTLKGLSKYPLPRPQVRIAQLLRERGAVR